MSTREEDRVEKEQKTKEEKLIGSKKRNKKKKKEEAEEEEREKAEEEYKPEVERSERVLLRGIFKVGKRSHDVLLTVTRLTWSPILPESPAGEACTSPPGVLMLRDVLAVKVKRRRAVGQRSGGPVLGVALFYCKRRGRRLEEDTLHLHNASSEHTHAWYNGLKEVLAGLSGRPRRVKVFINPCSHKKEAVHVYRERVAPLFKMADVRTDITVTERTGHALSVIKELKLDDFDGVVCVGGDGSVAEICHALVLRAQLDAGSPDVPVPASLPLGVIPAGSTDVVSCSVHGVRDAVTAAMHVILGHVQRVDMCSLRPPGGPPRFGFCAMFGFGGRSLALAEKKRWMPPARRRDYALLKTLARLRPEDCRLSFRAGCANDRDEHRDRDSEGTESWSSTEGLFLSVGVMAIPCLSPHAPRGLAPDTKLADGSATLTAVGATSRSEFVKHLKSYGAPGGQVSPTGGLTRLFFQLPPSGRRIRLLLHTNPLSKEADDASVSVSANHVPHLPQNASGQFVWIATDVFVNGHERSLVRVCVCVRACPQLDMSFVETRAVTAVKLRVRGSSGRPEDGDASFPWNVDGELLELPDEVLIGVHGRLIALYGEEVDEAESPASCGCI
ncbi:ceramide kinase-like protein [Hippocampus zosterae]|uniref:ceramide kinase-like protein n=1 Tax=Hippocampus zosterae TaxID=109293 RepID=UPI00223D9DF7|nr:ceramide kinase-like protein [Hippocampus zosterae]